MNVFVSETSINNSVEYFSKLSISSPEQFGLFFLCKGVGINQSTYKPLKKASQMTKDEKQLYYDRLHKLGAVFDFDEEGIKRCCLFPFSIKEKIAKGNYYNQASSFQSLLSRLIDTIDNTLIDKFLEKQEESIRLKRNYILLLKELYLNGNKISLSHFSTYYCRFVSFSTDESMDNGAFTRLCVNYTIDSLNILQRELDELFYDDTATQITFQEIMVTGQELRNKFTFKDIDDSPEIGSTIEYRVVSPYMLAHEDVRRFIELNGKNPSSNEIKELLELRKQLVLYGVPGIGKSRFIKELEDWKDDSEDQFFNETINIQFHPSTSYEEFIGGSSLENGSIVSKAGIFLKWCLKAKENDDKKYLFVIDEINRGNVSKIFGETILGLDREYTVDLVKPLKLEDGEQISKFQIPENLYIIATMNSADRSIAILDNAIRRRFAFIKLFPNYDIVNELSDVQELGINIAKLYRIINKKIVDTLNDEELLLGQSYFLPDFANKDETTGKILWSIKLLRLVINYNVLPTLEEYTYGNKNDLQNIMGEKIPERIYEDDDFIEAIKEQFPEIVL